MDKARIQKKLLTLITIVGITLRLINLNQSLWLDEAVQAILSQKSLSFIWFGRGGDFHPPLFYMLAHFWQSFSHSEIWLRMLPLTFGTLTIPAIYFLAKNNLTNNRQALLASFLISVAPFHIYYSQEYRSYSLLCLLCVISALAHLKKRFLLVGISNSLILYTHYSGAFFLLSQLIYTFLYQRPSLKIFFFSLFVTLVFYLPWLPQLYVQLMSGVNIDTYLPGWRTVLSLPTFSSLPLVIFKLIAGRITFLPKIVYGLYVLSVFAYTLICVYLSKSPKNIIWVFTPLILMILVSLFFPQTQPFRLIFILPWIIISITQASARFPKSIISIAVYISIFGNLLYFTRPQLQRENWRQASQYLFNANAPILVKFPEPFAPLQWYSPNLKYISYIPGQSLTTNSNTIYVLSYLSGLSDPHKSAESLLIKQGFTESSAKDFYGVGIITKYQK